MGEIKVNMYKGLTFYIFYFYIVALQGLVDSKCKEKDNDSGWIITWGYHNLFHGVISKKNLDDICPNRPLVVWHRSFHEIYLNTCAIEAMEFENQDEIMANAQV